MKKTVIAVMMALSAAPAFAAGRSCKTDVYAIGTKLNIVFTAKSMSEACLWIGKYEQSVDDLLNDVMGSGMSKEVKDLAYQLDQTKLSGFCYQNLGNAGGPEPLKMGDTVGLAKRGNEALAIINKLVEVAPR